MKNFRRANIYFIVIMLLEVLVPLFLQPVYHMLKIDNIGLMLVTNHILIFLVPAMIYLVITKSPIKKTLRLNKICFLDALLMVAIGLLCYPTSIIFSLITSLVFENNVSEVVGNLMSMPFILVILIVAVTPAITEEVTVRGIILSGYKNCSRFKGALITGFIFGMLHLDGQQFLYTTVIGFVLAMVVSITNSIFAGCIAHFTMNATSLVIQKLLSKFVDLANVDSSAKDSLLEMGLLPLIFAFVFWGSISIAAAVGIWAIIKSIEKRNIKKGIIEAEGKSKRFTESNPIDLSTVAVVGVYLSIMVIFHILQNYFI